jgi:phosphatidate cytidylyltransferase
MAFNWQTFRTRALTAIVFVAVMLGGLLWNKWSFFFLLSVIHFGCWNEFQNLLEKLNADYKKITSFHRYGFMVAGWAILLYFTNDELWVIGLRLREIGLWLGILSMILLPLILFIGSKNIFLKNMGQSTFGLLYISLSLGLFMDIRMTHEVASAWNLDLYLFYALFIILSLWINDTMAYIVGSLIGKTPLSPISPKKTWEGTVGGILLAIVVMSLIGRTGGLSIRNGALIAGIASISGTYGDLFESKLKRMAGVKDSGSIMPGHGGFLDRFDSLLFASTCCWIYIRLIIDLHI